MSKRATKKKTAAEIKAECEQAHDEFLDALVVRDNAQQRVTDLARLVAKLNRDYREAVNAEAGIATAKTRR